MRIAQRKPRLNRLAACLSAAFALGAADISAEARGLPQAGLSAGITYRVGALLQAATASTTRNVISCADDGSVGTLRQVIGISGETDTVDLSAVPIACSTITLVSGEIPITLNDLSLHGPTDRTLTITTSGYNRLLHHTGIGTLAIDHLTLSHGKYSSDTGDAFGGCVNSSGGVVLTSSVVTGCMVSVTRMGGFPSLAGGGAIYAKNFVQLHHSQITGNYALAFSSNRAQGGGVVSRGLYGYDSSVSGNSALGTSVSSTGEGGAAAVGGSVYLVRSTIDSNQADFAGGIYQSAAPSDSVRIRNSTISGNKANGGVGGIYADSPLRIDNSTVAFNSANSDAAIDIKASVITNSSIIAKNSISVSGFADLYISGSGSTLTGSNNLIVSSNLSLSGTLTSNPRLAPLANHGGPTRTHALVPLSPAVDQGNNTFPLTFDQRGSPFSREVPSGSPDIGAYERQVNDDEIFYDGVE